MPTQSDIEHLLRRTEFVARPARVTELLALPTREAVVDNVLGVPADPRSVVLVEPSDWERSEEYTHFWFNRMAHDSPRPIQEKIAFFWHGHFCSDLSKVGTAELMQQQIDLFRYQGMGNLRTLAKTMSTQVAMIRYLDNNDNRRTSPNQNFGRELMELFMLGVGNYTEAGRRGVDRCVDRPHRQLGDRRLRVARRLARQHHQDVPRPHDQRRQVAGGPDAARARDDRHDARHRGGAGDGDERRQPRPRRPALCRPSSSPASCGCSSPGRRLRRR